MASFTTTEMLTFRSSASWRSSSRISGVTRTAIRGYRALFIGFPPPFWLRVYLIILLSDKQGCATNFFRLIVEQMFCIIEKGDYMGWEWHDRKRDARGRWANLGKCEQIHIRCTVREWEMIRQDALKAKLTRSFAVHETSCRRLFLYEFVPFGKRCTPHAHSALLAVCCA